MLFNALTSIPIKYATRTPRKCSRIICRPNKLVFFVLCCLCFMFKAFARHDRIVPQFVLPSSANIRHHYKLHKSPERVLSAHYRSRSHIVCVRCLCPRVSLITKRCFKMLIALARAQPKLNILLRQTPGHRARRRALRPRTALCIAPY